MRQLRGNRFDLRPDRVAINKTGTTDWANAINGGVPGLEFPGIQPGETFTYRFPVMQSGTC